MQSSICLHYIIKLLEVLLSLKCNVNKHSNDKKADGYGNFVRICAFESECFDKEMQLSMRDCTKIVSENCMNKI